MTAVIDGDAVASEIRSDLVASVETLTDAGERPSRAASAR